jgi:hypothetical protein
MVRAQAYTLEAFVAALLILSSVVFALQVTAVTPLSASTSNQHLQGQEAAVAAGVLDAAVANGSLGRMLRYWDTDPNTLSFHNASEDGYYLDGPPTAFGHLLNRTLRAEGLAYNVELRFVTADGGVTGQYLVYQGSPSDEAVRTAATVALYDDDPTYDWKEEPTDTDVSAATGFFAPDAYPGRPLYNVVQVEVTVWRT